MFKKIILSSLFVIVGSAYAADREIPVSEIPKMVMDAIVKAHSNAKVIKAEEDSRGSNKYFEVKIQDGSTKRELHIQPDGTVLKNEAED